MDDTFFAEKGLLRRHLADTTHASIKQVLETKRLRGQETKKLDCKPTCNGLPQFSLLASGTLRIIVFVPSMFPDELKAISLDEMIKFLKEMTVENFEKVKKAAFTTPLEKWQGILFPAGSIVAEQCLSNTLLFGMRVPTVFKGQCL